MVAASGRPRQPYEPGFNLDDVEAGKYGQQLHFWDWKERAIDQSIDLGDKGLIPLEVRFPHDPASHAGLRRRGAVELDVALARPTARGGRRRR